MADKNDFGVPQVQDKRKSPEGLLPKNTQAWVIGGLALVMVIIIAFSGSTPPKQNRNLPEPPAAFDPNEARIKEYQKRIDEQTRRLEQEKAELARNQGTLDVLPEPDFRKSLDGEQFERENSLRSGPKRVPSATREKRDESLFASNIALSFRTQLGQTQSSQTPSSQTQPQTADASVENLVKFLPVVAAFSALQQQATGASVSSDQKPLADALPEQKPVPRVDVSPRNVVRGTYRILQGSVIETVLTNRLDGSFSGPVNCMVTTPIYSKDGQHVLLPAGSRVLGDVKPVNSFGQQRLAVVFHRLIMPDGYAVNLDQFQGLNQIGLTGLRDQINHHYGQVFGVSLAIGAIAGLGHANSRTGSDLSALDAYEQGVTSSLSQSSLRILDRYLNVLPTFTIREGHRVKIFLSADLLLPAYDEHLPVSNS